MSLPLVTIWSLQKLQLGGFRPKTVLAARGWRWAQRIGSGSWRKVSGATGERFPARGLCKCETTYIKGAVPDRSNKV